MKKYLQKIMAGLDLSEDESASAFDSIMSGDATPAQIAAFVVSLRMKGETIEEIAGAASSMRRYSIVVDTGGTPTVDTCGTGGDSLSTFNISTTAAFVACGAGVPVAKHGNRAITSKCGSADLLAELGVNIEAPHETVEECIRDIGIGFLFAPKLHPAMKHAMTPRREIGVRTIFNMLGPLTNPAGAKSQLIGVFAPELTETFANVLKILGSRHAFIVHGHDGMDEITTVAPSRVSELVNGRIKTYDLDPLLFIPSYAEPEELRGGTPSENAAITREVLTGKKGPQRDIVCINAAAAIVAGGRAADLKEGWNTAQNSIDTGNALEKLNLLITATSIRN